jgi:hypothetical protein
MLDGFGDFFGGDVPLNTSLCPRVVVLCPDKKVGPAKNVTATKKKKDRQEKKRSVKQKKKPVDVFHKAKRLHPKEKRSQDPRGKKPEKKQKVATIAFDAKWQRSPENKAGISLKRGLFIRNGRLDRVFSLIRQGYGNKAISRREGISPRAARRYRNVLEKLEGRKFLCPCGQLATHKGWCEPRIENSEKRKAYLNKFDKMSGPRG